MESWKTNQYTLTLPRPFLIIKKNLIPVTLISSIVHCTVCRYSNFDKNGIIEKKSEQAKNVDYKERTRYRN